MKIKTPKTTPDAAPEAATTTAPEAATPPPASKAPSGQPTVLAVREGIVGRGTYRVSVFKWSDGKFGGTVDATFPFEPGKTPEQTAEQANNYACEMLRGLHESLAKAFK